MSPRARLASRPADRRTAAKPSPATAGPISRRARLRSGAQGKKQPHSPAQLRSAPVHGRADHPASVHLPLLRHTTSRSFSFERYDTIFPSTHISVTMVSPGNTGAEKRTSKPTIFVGSYLQTVEITERQAVPYEHSPCRLGRGKPAIFATFGSRCSGLRSPDSA